MLNSVGSQLEVPPILRVFEVLPNAIPLFQNLVTEATSYEVKLYCKRGATRPVEVQTPICQSSLQIDRLLNEARNGGLQTFCLYLFSCLILCPLVLETKF